MEPTDDTRVSQIRKIVIEWSLASEEPIISGSDIGSIVKEDIQDVDFRYEFSGLTSFVRDYCNGKIIHVGKRGGDNLFVHVDRQNEVPGGIKPRNQKPWVVFSDPRINKKLFSNPETGEFLVSDSSIDIGEKFVEIKPLSESDYRDIAIDFLKNEIPQGNSVVMDSLMDIIQKTDFWFDFVKSVQNHLGQSCYKRLLQWRILKINKLFANRLEEIGMRNSLINIVMRQLSKKPSGFANSIDKQKSDHMAYNSLSNRSLTHAVFHKVIDLMSQEELRNIHLPIGKVIDAMGKLS